MAAALALGTTATLRAEPTPAERAATPHIQLQADGTFVLDGQRRFVYGTYRDPSDDRTRFEGLIEGRFDLTHSYDFENPLGDPQGRADRFSDLNAWLTAARQYLADADRHGVGVFMGLPRDLLAAEDTESIRTIVEALRDEPALWFWYLKDEPSYQRQKQPQLADTLARVYGLIKSLDPQRPVVVADNQYFHDYPYDTMADQIWTDRYPAPWGILPVKEVLDEANRAFPDLPRAWAVPSAGSPLVDQASRNKTYEFVRLNDQNYRVNPREIRAQGHAAIAGGARGIVWYWYPNRWHDLRAQTPGVWRAIVDLGAELDQLEPALLSTQTGPAVEVKVQPTSRMQRLDRAYYLSGRIDPAPPVPVDYDYRLASEVLHWTRWHDGALYVGLVNAGYQTNVVVDLTLPFAFGKAVQYPQGIEVMRVDDGGLTVRTEHLPVALLSVKDRRQLRLVLNETDTVVWRFEKP